MHNYLLRQTRDYIWLQKTYVDGVVQLQGEPPQWNHFLDKYWTIFPYCPWYQMIILPIPFANV
jgi:hypothetical protein